MSAPWHGHVGGGEPRLILNGSKGRAMSMAERISVYGYAHDPISQAGIASQLRARPEILIVENDIDSAAVAIVVVDEVDDDATRVIKAIQRNNGIPRVVLVVTRLDDAGMLA